MLLQTKALRATRIAARYRLATLGRRQNGGRGGIVAPELSAATSSHWSHRIEPVSLRERSLVVSETAESGRLRSYSCPQLPFDRLSDVAETHFAKRSTNSWKLPSVAVKNAELFFDENPTAESFVQRFVLHPRHNWTAVSYSCALFFTRDLAGHVAVRQKLGCELALRDRRKSVISLEHQALWITSEGSTSHSPGQLSLTAVQISDNGKDLFEPLSTAFSATVDSLRSIRAADIPTLTNIGLDMADHFETQKQPWNAKISNIWVKDRTNQSCGISVLAGQLGRQYRRESGFHRAIIALGSNMGDRMKYLEQALFEMNRRGITVRSTSFLYETKAMYYEDQDQFLNGVCEVETSLKPLHLLSTLQQIEKELQRVKIIDKGPRTIDLDILLYDFDTLDDPRLQIPHKSMIERDFVLRPLADIIPDERLPAPHSYLSVLGHLKNLEVGNSRPLPSIISSFGSKLPPFHPNNPRRQTQVMAILNMTPDSFSDGGTHDLSDINALETTIRNFIADGATIIDVGGQSTRPGAALISPLEELNRVLPAIQRIRAMPEAQNIAISIDTFYSAVAREAVAAGADIINDVSGGAIDPQILSVAAELRATVILMHMRGMPDTMKHLTDYPEGVVTGVGKELKQRVEEALKAGVPRWRIVLDPGIGFAKTNEQNIELLRKLSTLREFPGLENFPWLVGTSRKGFIGKITGLSSAADRSWGTAATVTASVAGGADIVRVHDVAEMSQVVKMADAMYRHPPSPSKGTNPIDLSNASTDQTPSQTPTSWPLSAEFLAALEKAYPDFRQSLRWPLAGESVHSGSVPDQS